MVTSIIITVGMAAAMGIGFMIGREVYVIVRNIILRVVYYAKGLIAMQKVGELEEAC